MDPAMQSLWQPRIRVAHIKRGRSLVTAILHVDGIDTPPAEALCAAVADWKSAPAGQIVRRPDESGRQVYWINVVAGEL